MSISITIASGEGGVTTATVTGDLDLVTSPELRDALLEQVAHHPPRLVVDLRGVSFMDSTAIGVIVGAHKRQQAGGGAFTVVLGRELRRLFDLTGLDGYLDLRDEP